MAEKKTVRIMFDYLQGPIWLTDIDTGKPYTGIEVIDNDPIIRELCYESSQMFSSYYKFDYDDKPCVFDYEEEKRDKEIMLKLLNALIARLNEINDGSFEIRDYVTEYYKNL